MQCPKCQKTNRQIRDGHTASGSQRYRCRYCGCRYTPAPKEHGYSDEIRLQAVRMYLEGMSLRAIGRVLRVNHQSAANWIRGYASQLAAAPLPEEVDVAELDEMFTFVGSKKTTSTS
jgi:transposase-like protein